MDIAGLTKLVSYIQCSSLSAIPINVFQQTFFSFIAKCGIMNIIIYLGEHRFSRREWERMKCRILVVTGYANLQMEKTALTVVGFTQSSVARTILSSIQINDLCGMDWNSKQVEGADSCCLQSSMDDSRMLSETFSVQSIKAAMKCAVNMLLS